jgi:hypothetical protein
VAITSVVAPILLTAQPSLPCSRTGPSHKPKKGHQTWFVIPQWLINQGRRHLYQDFIHFAGTVSCRITALLLCCYRMSPTSLSYPALTFITVAGPLADAGLYQILNILCPQFGTDLHIPTLPSNDELLNKLIVDDITGAEYLVDPAAYLHMLPNTTATGNPPANTGNEASNAMAPVVTSGTKAVNALREHTASLTLTTEQISFLPLAPEPMRNIFADRTLIRQHDLKQVYVVYGGRKYTVTLADFYAQGYEFSDVVGITAWEMGLLPEGGAFTPSVINS